MDPSDNPANPNAPGPPVSSSQGGFHFQPSPFTVPSFGQIATGTIFGQNAQFGTSSAAQADWKPSNDPVYSNPFAATKSASSSIFGGRSGDNSSDSSAVAMPQMPVGRLENTEAKGYPTGSGSTIMAKPRFPPTTGSLFGGHSVDQSGGNIQISMDSNTTTVTRQTVVTTYTDTTDQIVGNMPAEPFVAKGERKREGGKHAMLNSVLKNRIRNIISENRVEDEDEELTNLQKMKESLLRKLADRKIEKKRKSTDSNDGSPGKVTKEDKALYFTLPNETFTKAMIKEHFSTFGEIFRVYFNTTKNHCIVHFARHEDAVKAYENGSLINGCAVRLFWRNIVRSKKKSESSKDTDGKKHHTSKKRLLDIDPEVQEELAAMGGLEKYRPLNVPKRSDEPSLKRLSRLKETSKVSKKESSHRIESSKETELQTEKGADVGTSDVFIEATAGAQELVAIMKTAAASLEDRLRILEARDKLIRLGQVRQCDLAHAKKTVGVCPDMCPEKERLLRETRRQVSFYEMDESSKRMNPVLAVKQYARSSADQEEPLPHELRPLPVMAMTMSYLLHCIADLCDRPGENLAEWYHYLWDRTRSIRKEITQQELCDLESVQLVEQCARFHIHCCARLVAEDVSVFDHRINTENLTKCLQTLKHMYYDLWVKHNQTCPNEAEFMSYFLMLNLNNGSVMWELEQLREDVLQTPEINFAARLYMAINSNNFVRFFRLVRSASYLASCLAIRYFYQVRTLALRTHIKALNARDKPILYPLAAVVRELAFEDFTQGEHFCAHHGLSVDHSQPDVPQVLFSRNTFRIATTVFAASRALGLVESKRNGSVGEVIAGGSLPPRTFDNHVPHESFDGNGFLKPSAWYAVDQGMTPSDLSFEEELGNISEKDSSATPSETGEVVQAAFSSHEPQPVITEPPEDDGRTPVLPTPKSLAQISEVPTSLPDIIVVRNPIVEDKPGTETSSFSQPSQIKSIFGTSSTSSTTWMSQSNTTQFKSIFGTSPIKPTSSGESRPTPPAPIFSKTSVVTSTTNTFSSFSGTSSAIGSTGFGGAVGTSASLGGASCNLSTGVTQSSPMVKSTSAFGVSNSISGTGSAFGEVTSIFGGTPTTSTDISTTTSTTNSTPVNSVPFVIPTLKKYAVKAPTAGIPVQKVPQVDHKTLLEADAAATKREAEAKKRAEARKEAEARKKAEAKEAEEKLRARLLENHVTRVSMESLDKFIAAELRQIAEELLRIAKETAKKEKEEMEKRAVELSETLMTEVLLKELEELAAEELDKAIEERERMIRRIAAKYFKRWLEKARLSLSRKRAIENFPAGVTHLSLQEHAKRWGMPSLAHVQDFVKQNAFHVRGIPKLDHSWTSLSSLVGKEIMLRYHDQCRKLRWKHSNEAAFKVLVSVSSDSSDRSSRVTEWFVRNPLQLKHGTSFEDPKLGVLRTVTTFQLAPDQIVHSSLQLVRGAEALRRNPELSAGTSAILFCMNLSENIHACCDRLEAVLDPMSSLPSPPLVVIVFGNQTAMDAVTLKSLVSNLGLYKKLRRSVIGDYKVLYLREASDLLTVDCELKKILLYAAQNWRPPQQFTVKPLRTVLMGAFDMFFISLKCSLDRSQPNSKSINDPKILAELCNEFLKYICAVLLRSRRESKSLCAPEMWPNIYKGAYNRFHDHPSYEPHIASLLSSMQIPKDDGWPPGDPNGFRAWLGRSQSVVSQSAELIDRWSKVSPWPQVLEDIPWIQVFKSCMEKKFQESNMSGLTGSELYVVIDIKRLEKLHNDPWWKHSRKLHLYLSKFEEQAENPVLVDVSNRNKMSECDPPLKKRCLDEKVVEESMPNVEEISQIIEDHQRSLRKHNEDDSMGEEGGGPNMSRLEIIIDSLQSRLGLGPYSGRNTVEAEPKKVVTRKLTDPTPLEGLQREKETEVPKEAEPVSQPPEPSRESASNKMKKILEAARRIVEPLQLPSPTSKHREIVHDFLVGRGKSDFSAVNIPLTALSQSDFVERSKREVEERIHVYKHSAKSDESEEEPEPYSEESSNTRSDLSSLDKRRYRRRKISDRSSISEESLNSVVSYSVTSDEEKSDYSSDNYDRESPEYDNYEESRENTINGGVAVEVLRSSNDVNDEEEEFAEEIGSSSDAREDEEEVSELEESFNEEEMEGENLEEVDDEEHEMGGSDIKITDDEEEVEDEAVNDDEVSESDIRSANDDDDMSNAFMVNNENLVEEMEDEGVEGGEDYEEEDECEGEEEYEEDNGSDVLEISSDEEVDVKKDVSEEESTRQSNSNKNYESSSDEVVSD